MPTNKTSESTLTAGDYQIDDPGLLKHMRLSCDVEDPESDTILVIKYTPITEKLVERLIRFKVDTVSAEPIVEKTIAASIEYVDKTFSVIEGILVSDDSKVADVTEALTNRTQMHSLEQLIRNNLDDIEELFSANATEKLVALTQHHNGTARHSLIAAFQLMAIGRELGWNDSKIVKAAMALINHDIGKAKVNLNTLDCPGRLNSKQWKEIQFHPLFGCRMLYQPGLEPDLIMLSALLHHEWYAEVDGKGYGGLTLYGDFVKRAMKFDVSDLIANMDTDNREIIQITSLADMVSALEESRAYKRGLDSFKVLIIMNSDAKMGHFHPKHFQAWHRIYCLQNPNMLPLGRRMALPREKENRIFTNLPAKKIHPTPLLTHYDMDKMGFLPLLRNVGMDMERIRRRGGLTVKVLKQINKEKSLDLDLSASNFKSHNINPIKDRLVREEQVIELDAWRKWLTVKELDKSGLMARAKQLNFDLNLIRRDGGIRPDRLEKRGIKVNEDKLASLNIELLKKLPVKLPGSENRLTADDLAKLGITDVNLKNAGCLERVKAVKSGVPLDWLLKNGVAITGAMMTKNGIDPVRKVFYDIQVDEEISSSKAIFRILREGDDPKELELLSAKNGLGSIQNILLNQVGHVIMDFSDLLALPDLSHIVMGKHWGSSSD
jgi:HD-GYP domain-containing protein (c-di-GMP phosphodiesterase class II)